MGGVIQAFGARARLNGSRSRLDWRLELPQGIFDSQKHDFPSGLAHVFRDPKHPAYGFNFYVKVEMWIVNVRSALQVHKMCSRIQIRAEPGTNRLPRHRLRGKSNNSNRTMTAATTPHQKATGQLPDSQSVGAKTGQSRDRKSKNPNRP